MAWPGPCSPGTSAVWAVGLDLPPVQSPAKRGKAKRGRLWLTASSFAEGFVASAFFTICTTLVIVASFAFLVIEVNADAKCYPEYAHNFSECPFSSSKIQWLDYANTVLLLLFSIECLARLCAERCRFLCNCWNCIDAATVLVGFLGKLWSSTLNVNFLRAFRLLCIGRSSRMVTSIPELYFLLVALCASIRALALAAALLMFIVFLWAIIVVEALHPVLSTTSDSSSTGSDASDAAWHRDVWSAARTVMLQLTGWNQEDLCLQKVVEDAPWTVAIFFGIWLSISFGAMNVVLVLILECATRAYAQDERAKREAHAASHRDAQHGEHLHQLAVVCSDLDVMRRGILPVADIMDAYQEDVGGFRANLTAAGLETKEQLETLCSFLSTQGGHVTTVDFLQHVKRLRRKDVARDAFVAYAVQNLHRIVLKSEHKVPRRRVRLAHASPTAQLAQPEEQSPQPEQEALRRRWARHCLQSFEGLQKSMEPLLMQAEAVLQEVLEDTAFEPPFQVCRIDIDTLDTGAGSPDMPSRYDWLLDQRSLVLNESIRRNLNQLSSLQEKLTSVTQRLMKLRSGFDGRTESL